MGDAQQPIRVGLIGVGWGSVVQTPAFSMVPPFVVSALCSRRAERVAAAGEKLGIADVSTDWRAFVERDDLEVISICTPVDLHHEQAMAAIAAGKHVLVEKPVGLDSGQTGEMVAAAREAGVANAVCFENRWDPARLAIWDLVRSGHLGDPYLAMARSGADYWHPSRGLQSEWMYRKDDGGGYLMGMASHDIDYTCALFGEPEAVCADVRTSVPARQRPDGSTLAVDADDTSVLLLRMRNGMTVTIATTAIALQRNFKAFEAYGSHGSVAVEGSLMGEDDPDIRVGSVELDQGTVLPASSRRPASGLEAPKRRAAGAITALALMLEEWLPALRGEPTSAPSLADGHRVQRVVDAARRSSNGEGWVQL